MCSFNCVLGNLNLHKHPRRRQIALAMKGVILLYCLRDTRLTYERAELKGWAARGISTPSERCLAAKMLGCVPRIVAYYCSEYHCYRLTAMRRVNGSDDQIVNTSRGDLIYCGGKVFSPVCSLWNSRRCDLV